MYIYMKRRKETNEWKNFSSNFSYLFPILVCYGNLEGGHMRVVIGHTISKNRLHES